MRGADEPKAGGELPTIPGLDPEMLKPSVKNIAAILAGLGTILGVNGFLRDYLGDVQMWTTYEETDVKYENRNDILEVATAMLQHVLVDDRCTRVLVVAHSLGTAVALDSLLQLGRFNRARPASRIPLEKIDQLITMGSPIDKIHYFFESYAGKYHRYNRLVEDLTFLFGHALVHNDRHFTVTGHMRQLPRGSIGRIAQGQFSTQNACMKSCLPGHSEYLVRTWSDCALLQRFTGIA